MPDLMITPAPLPAQSGAGSVNAPGPSDAAGRPVDGATTDTGASGTESPFAAVLKSRMDKKAVATDAANSADSAAANAAGYAVVSVDLSALLPLLGANPAAAASFAANPVAAQAATASPDEKPLAGLQAVAVQATPEVLAALPATPNATLPATPNAAVDRSPPRPGTARPEEAFASVGTAKPDPTSQTAGKIAPDAAITADAGHKRVESAATELPANDFHALLERAAAMSPGAPANAAASSQNLRIDTPLGQTGWRDEVGQKLTWMIGNNRQLADLVLTPPLLGRVEVSLTMHGDQASAIFTSSNPAVREALEGSLHRLREVLAEAGVSLGQAQVGSESPNQSARHKEIDFGRDEGVRYASSVALPSTAGAARTSAGRGMIDIFA